MNISEPKSVTVPEIALIAATRGAIGFGAGLLLAGRFKRELREWLGWILFLSGLASTIPIAMHVFSDRSSDGHASSADGDGETLAEATSAATSASTR